MLGLLSSSALDMTASLQRLYCLLPETDGRATKADGRLYRSGQATLQSTRNADVAQLVEQPIRNRQVTGSSPVVGSRQGEPTSVPFVFRTPFSSFISVLRLAPLLPTPHNRASSLVADGGFGLSTSVAL